VLLIGERNRDVPEVGAISDPNDRDEEQSDLDSADSAMMRQAMEELANASAQP
jgi:hypothetical protein